MPPPYPPFRVIPVRGTGDGLLPGPGEPVVRLYNPPPRYVPTPIPVLAPANALNPVFNIANRTPLPLFNPPTHVPVVVPDPFLSRPVPIFDITGRTTSRILRSIPAPPPVRILRPEEIRQQKREARRAEEEREDAEFRAIEQWTRLRRYYNDGHAHLVALKYEIINAKGQDITGPQFDLLEIILGEINTQSLRARSSYPPAFGDTVKSRIDACDAWIDMIRPALVEWCQAREPFLDVKAIAKQLTETVEETEDLIGRKKLKPELAAMVQEFAAYELIYNRFLAAANLPCNNPRSPHSVRQAGGQLAGLTKKLIRLQTNLEEIGARIEGAVPNIRATIKIAFTAAQKLHISAWGAVCGPDNSIQIVNQIRKILTTGDFRMLRELTDIVRHIKANRHLSPLRYGAIDLNAHVLIGSLKGHTSFDFPFLNKTRLNLPNRGIWRIVFKGTAIHGIYNDHNGDNIKWSGEGLEKS